MENVVDQAKPYVNVGHIERAFSVVLGTALAAYGLSRRSIAGAGAALLGAAVVWRGVSGHCQLFHVLGLSTAEEDNGRQVSVPYGRGIRVEKSVTVNAPPEELYRFWRNFENLPRFLSHLQSVKVIDDKRSHWVTKGPIGTDAEWDAEIINEIPNALIGWRSVDGSNVRNAGSVHFTRSTGNRGTEMRVVLRYDPPAGAIGDAIAKMFGTDAALEVQEDLRIFKQLIEAGQTAHAS